MARLRGERENWDLFLGSTCDKDHVWALHVEVDWIFGEKNGDWGGERDDREREVREEKKRKIWNDVEECRKLWIFHLKKKKILSGKITILPFA
jgi:hypothetical protein